MGWKSIGWKNTKWTLHFSLETLPPHPQGPLSEPKNANYVQHVSFFLDQLYLLVTLVHSTFNRLHSWGPLTYSPTCQYPFVSKFSRIYMHSCSKGKAKHPCHFISHYSMYFILFHSFLIHLYSSSSYFI